MSSEADLRYLDQINWRTKGHIRFLSWPTIPSPILQANLLHELSEVDKQMLFEDFKPTQIAQVTRAEVLLAKLAHIAPELATKFELKPDLIKEFPMRLIYGGNSPGRSYIALSYCWSDAYRDMTRSERPERLSSDLLLVPLSALLFKAVLAERGATDEGLWIDQLCINQKNKEERRAAVAAMDTLYRKARIVFVALEDIEVSEVEQKFLEGFISEFEESRSILDVPHYGEQPPFVEKNIVLRDFFHKITSSKWFTRAWCAHEMQLGQKHMFYIPCKTTGPYNGNRVLGLSEIIRKKRVRETIERKFNIQAHIMKTIRLLEEKPGDLESVGMDYVHAIRTIFELNAGGDPDLSGDRRVADGHCDKVSIVLNVLGNGLSLKRSVDSTSSYISLDECYRQLLILALVAGDPLSLCCLGRPLKPTVNAARSSWLCEPTAVDNRSGSLFAFPALSTDSILLDQSPESVWIELDGISPTAIEHLDDEIISCAEQLVCESILLGLGLAPGGIQSTLDTGLEFQYWRCHTDTNKQMFRRFILTVGCVLEAGLDWALKVSQDWRFPSMMLEVWQEKVLEYFPDGFEVGKLTEMKWTKTKSGVDAVNVLLKFSSLLILLGQPSYTGGPTDIRLPQMYSLDSGGKVLAFSQPSTLEDSSIRDDLQEHDSKYDILIPKCLLKDEYSPLSRGWVKKTPQATVEDVESAISNVSLQDVESGSVNRKAQTAPPELVWKTRLFSDVSISLETTRGWKKGDHIRKYGPE